MAIFLPSEIARLVLGYLKEEGCKKSYKCFLNECPHLEEYNKLIQQGTEYPTQVGGRSLNQMLLEYGSLKLQTLNNSDTGDLWTKLHAILEQLKTSNQGRNDLRVATNAVSTFSKLCNTRTRERMKYRGDGKDDGIETDCDVMSDIVSSPSVSSHVGDNSPSSDLSVSKTDSRRRYGSNQSVNSSDNSHYSSFKSPQRDLSTLSSNLSTPSQRVPVQNANSEIKKQTTVVKDVLSLGSSPRNNVNRASTSETPHRDIIVKALKTGVIDKESLSSQKCKESTNAQSADVKASDSRVPNVIEHRTEVQESNSAVPESSVVTKADEVHPQTTRKHNFSPSIGHDLPSELETAFPSITTASPVTPCKNNNISNLKTPMKTPLKSFLNKEHSMDKFKSPKRKSHVPKRRSWGPEATQVVLPPTPVKQCTPVKSVTPIKVPQDADKLIEELLMNSKLAEKLAETINMKLVKGDESGTGTTPKNEDKKNISMESTTDRLLTNEELDTLFADSQMNEQAIQGIIDMTRTDPDFENLFQMFHVDKEEYIASEYGSTVPINPSLDMSRPLDKDANPPSLQDMRSSSPFSDKSAKPKASSTISTPRVSTETLPFNVENRPFSEVSTNIDSVQNTAIVNTGNEENRLANNTAAYNSPQQNVCSSVVNDTQSVLVQTGAQLQVSQSVLNCSIQSNAFSTAHSAEPAIENSLDQTVLDNQVIEHRLVSNVAAYNSPQQSVRSSPGYDSPQPLVIATPLGTNSPIHYAGSPQYTNSPQSVIGSPQFAKSPLSNTKVSQNTRSSLVQRSLVAQVTDNNMTNSTVKPQIDGAGDSRKVVRRNLNVQVDAVMTDPNLTPTLGTKAANIVGDGPKVARSLQAVKSNVLSVSNNSGNPKTQKPKQVVLLPNGMAVLLSPTKDITSQLAIINKLQTIDNTPQVKTLAETPENKKITPPATRYRKKNKIEKSDSQVTQNKNDNLHPKVIQGKTRNSWGRKRKGSDARSVDSSEDVEVVELSDDQIHVKGKDKNTKKDTNMKNSTEVIKGSPVVDLCNDEEKPKRARYGRKNDKRKVLSVPEKAKQELSKTDANAKPPIASPVPLSTSTPQIKFSLAPGSLAPRQQQIRLVLNTPTSASTPGQLRLPFPLKFPVSLKPATPSTNVRPLSSNSCTRVTLASSGNNVVNVQPPGSSHVIRTPVSTVTRIPVPTSANATPTSQILIPFNLSPTLKSSKQKVVPQSNTNTVNVTSTNSVSLLTSQTICAPTATNINTLPGLQPSVVISKSESALARNMQRSKKGCRTLMAKTKTHSPSQNWDTKLTKTPKKESPTKAAKSTKTRSQKMSDSFMNANSNSKSPNVKTNNKTSGKGKKCDNKTAEVDYTCAKSKSRIRKTEKKSSGKIKQKDIVNSEQESVISTVSGIEGVTLHLESSNSRFSNLASTLDAELLKELDITSAVSKKKVEPRKGTSKNHVRTLRFSPRKPLSKRNSGGEGKTRPSPHKNKKAKRKSKESKQPVNENNSQLLSMPVDIMDLLPFTPTKSKSSPCKVGASPVEVLFGENSVMKTPKNNAKSSQQTPKNASPKIQNRTPRRALLEEILSPKNKKSTKADDIDFKPLKSPTKKTKSKTKSPNKATKTTKSQNAKLVSKDTLKSIEPVSNLSQDDIETAEALVTLATKVVVTPKKCRPGNDDTSHIVPSLTFKNMDNADSSSQKNKDSTTLKPTVNYSTVASAVDSVTSGEKVNNLSDAEKSKLDCEKEISNKQLDEKKCENVTGNKNRGDQENCESPKASVKLLPKPVFITTKPSGAYASSNAKPTNNNIVNTKARRIVPTLLSPKDKSRLDLISGSQQSTNKSTHPTSILKPKQEWMQQENSTTSKSQTVTSFTSNDKDTTFRPVTSDQNRSDNRANDLSRTKSVASSIPCVNVSGNRASGCMKSKTGDTSSSKLTFSNCVGNSNEHLSEKVKELSNVDNISKSNVSNCEENSGENSSSNDKNLSNVSNFSKSNVSNYEEHSNHSSCSGYSEKPGEEHNASAVISETVSQITFESEETQMKFPKFGKNSPIKPPSFKPEHRPYDQAGLPITFVHHGEDTTCCSVIDHHMTPTVPAALVNNNSNGKRQYDQAGLPIPLINQSEDTTSFTFVAYSQNTNESTRKSDSKKGINTCSLETSPTPSAQTNDDPNGPSPYKILKTPVKVDQAGLPVRKKVPPSPYRMLPLERLIEQGKKEMIKSIAKKKKRESLEGEKKKRESFGDKKRESLVEDKRKTEKGQFGGNGGKVESARKEKKKRESYGEYKKRKQSHAEGNDKAESKRKEESGKLTTKKRKLDESVECGKKKKRKTVAVSEMDIDAFLKEVHAKQTPKTNDSTR